MENYEEYHRMASLMTSIHAQRQEEPVRIEKREEVEIPKTKITFGEEVK